jgi:hypothetical protein
MGAWGVPGGILATSELCSLEGALRLSRATHASAACWGIHEVHPLSLIARASQGDRQAVLDLVKVDYLFLHDRSTEKVIKEAELRNDHSFMEQLARAQTYQPKLRRRTVHRLHFYLLFMLEDQGTQLPTEQELDSRRDSLLTVEYHLSRRLPLRCLFCECKCFWRQI